MRRTPLLVGLLALVGVAVATPATASAVAAPPTEPVPLVPASMMMRLGDPISVTGAVCPTGLTVTSLSLLDQADRSKGLSPWVPLDPGTIGLTQTASGLSFHYTPTAAYHLISFKLECSDGSEGTMANPVKVFPPTGFYWAFNNYGPYFTATPGFTFYFGANTIECPAGSPATGTLVAPGASQPYLTMEGTIGGDVYRGVTFDMDLPADMPIGAYTGTIACGGGTDGVLAAAVSDSQPVYVGVLPSTGNDDMPPAGGGGALVPAALGAVAVGLGMAALARRPRLRRSH